MDTFPQNIIQLLTSFLINYTDCLVGWSTWRRLHRRPLLAHWMGRDGMGWDGTGRDARDRGHLSNCAIQLIYY